jgi:hypothetical protein
VSEFLGKYAVRMGGACNWSGLCPMAGFSISSVEPSGSAIRQTSSYISLKYVVRTGGGWNCLRTMLNDRLCY